MSMLPWLEAGSIAFPPVSKALDEPNGLLAAGGDLCSDQLLAAYQKGIFPWYSEGQPILWWSPSPRLIIRPSDLHVSKSMAKLLKRKPFSVTTNVCFQDVMEACAAPREGEDGTWICPDMINAYCQLNELGYAHSIEVWEESELIGGLYGLAIGGLFFGESMFSRKSNASKYGFITLVKALETAGYQAIDCQVYTPHLASLGAREVDRQAFEKMLRDYIPSTLSPRLWPPAGFSESSARGVITTSKSSAPGSV